jgi:hypothetical protein
MIMRLKFADSADLCILVSMGKALSDVNSTVMLLLFTYLTPANFLHIYYKI